MRFTTLLMVFFMLAVSAAPSGGGAAAMHREIDHLLAYLAGSDCLFYRNGTWYGAEEAVAHIKRKYDYLKKRGLIHSAEQFIDRAASESSMSRRPYRVKCGGADPVASSVWFMNELQAHRKQAAAGRFD